jgi:hypothetical protein
MNLRQLARQPGLIIAALLWGLLTVAGLALTAGTPRAQSVIWGSVALVVLLIEIGIAHLISRKRPPADLAQRAPERATALRETVALWCYAGVVMAAGRVIGIHYFGEGIGLHLNGSLVGATRVQPPAEVYAWAAWNGVLLALVPYVVFRLRGYSNRSLNLRSANLRNDTLVIVVVLAINLALDLFLGPSILQLTPHQQLVGGVLSFILHLCGTGFPVMIFIYAILVPRYARLTSPVTAFLLGAASYPTLHIFESWTRYDSLPHAALSIILVYLTFFPPGLMKSFLTFRTGNAWVHLWAFHAISPHVTIDTRLIVHDFDIR